VPGTASSLVWTLTVLGLIGIIVADLAVLGRRRQSVSSRDALTWVGIYVGLAVAFGIALAIWAGPETGRQFAAGYVTEYSLSVDNLFVFMVIMARFDVPEIARDRVLFIGIALSLVLRAVCIAAGAAALAAFSWTFFVFGALLIYTAITLLRESDDEDRFEEYALVRAFRRVVPSVSTYHGTAMTVRADNRQLFTPLVFVIATISVANVLFALDSIPAIFGLTQDPYVVFTANALALMGLRQLYFLVADLLERIVYLNTGLAVILAFIGIKLLLEALHAVHVEHLGALDVPRVTTTESLVVIAATLAVTFLASHFARRSDGEAV
jgi:TerC family integral membrane protein